MRIASALLLVLSLAMPACAQDAKSLTTILLVARDELPDPNFKRSRVLVMNNIGPAPAGVIINRPTKITVARVFPDMEKLARFDDRIYFGGPVELGVLSFIFRADKPPENATRVVDDVFISTDRDLLHELLSRDAPMRDLRIFMGYSGWSSGQLEDEIGRGDWKIERADAKAMFGHEGEYPWPENATADTGGQRI